MDERLFVIMEIGDTGEKIGKCGHYKPLYGGSENLWLKPENVIKKSDLYYGSPYKGSEYLTTGFVWVKAQANYCTDSIRLIRKPRHPKSALDQWLDSAPNGVCQEVKEWIKKMPQGGDK